MVIAVGCRPAAPLARPPLEVGDVIRAFGDAYRLRYDPPPRLLKVMRALAVCRTAALGGHLDICDTCGHERPAYNSCRDRHCPKCQSLEQARWVAARMERVLPVRHFHVVFTLPAELRSLALANRVVVYGILIRAAADSLLEFGRDPKWIGGQLGLTLVLHTWTRDLQFHPHVHCVVTDGGLDLAGTRWISGRGKGRFLFPVKALAKVFRAKFVAALVRGRKAGKLRYSDGCATLADDASFTAFREQLFRQPWVTYAKRPFRDADGVFEYLGRYTHRVGISNHRLVSMTDDQVCFRTKDGKTVTVEAVEFIRRFLLHVLPKGFVKIRHYGLLAGSNVYSRLKAAHEILSAAPRPTGSCPDTDWRDLFAALTGLDLDRCPACGLGLMRKHPLPDPALLTTDSSPPPR